MTTDKKAGLESLGFKKLVNEFYWQNFIFLSFYRHEGIKDYSAVKIFGNYFNYAPQGSTRAFSPDSTGNCNANAPRPMSLMRDTFTLSFGGEAKKSLEELVKKHGEENIPLSVLKKLEDGNEENLTLEQIHRKTYERLGDCKTLEEAKALYPEFSNVMDVFDIEGENPLSLLGKIKNRKIEGVEPEGFSLSIIKQLYGELKPVQQLHIELGMSKSSFRALIVTLGIKPLSISYVNPIFGPIYSNARWAEEGAREEASKLMSDKWKNDPKYREAVTNGQIEHWKDDAAKERKSKATERNWQREEYRTQQSVSRRRSWDNDPVRKQKSSERMEARWQKPEYRNKMLDLLRERWLDPNYILRMSEAQKTVWQNPEYVDKMSDIRKQVWQNPEYVDKMSNTQKQRYANDPKAKKMFKFMVKYAWEKMPDTKEKMSEVAKGFPGLADIINKEKSRKTLSDNELSYVRTYHAAWQEACPDFAQRWSDNLKEGAKMYKELMKDAPEYITADMIDVMIQETLNALAA